MNRVFKVLNFFDMFQQSKQFNVSSDNSTYRTSVGSLCSLVVYALSITYLVMRLIVLVTYAESNVNVLNEPNTVPSDEVYKLKVGNTEANGFDFRVAVSVMEKRNPATMDQLAEFGTISFMDQKIGFGNKTI